jgi:S1-C subfamily serine protease
MVIKGFRIASYVAAACLSVGAGFGLANVIHHPSVAVPAAPAKNDVFVEDYNGTGQDNQENVLTVTAPGVVELSADGKGVDAGVIITRSGLVLASDHDLTGTLTATMAMTGKKYPGRVIGTDAVANIALLQLSGSTSFPDVKLGNSDDIRLGDQIGSVGATGTSKSVVLSTGDVIGINVPGSVNGHRLSGLLEVNSLDRPAQETGGPLVNLSGQVLGIGIAATDSGVAGSGYVVPIDAALAIARQIAG